MYARVRWLTLTPTLTRSSFSGRSISVKQVGHAVLRVANSSGSEDLYLITLPNLVIEGLWYGAPYLELSGTSHIVSSTGMLATINYAGKGERASEDALTRQNSG